MSEHIAKDRIDALVNEACDAEADREYALASWLMMAAVRLLDATPELANRTSDELRVWSRQVRHRQRQIEIALLECRMRCLLQLRSSGDDPQDSLDRRINQAKTALQRLKSG